MSAQSVLSLEPAKRLEQLTWLGCSFMPSASTATG